MKKTAITIIALSLSASSFAMNEGVKILNERSYTTGHPIHFEFTRKESGESQNLKYAEAHAYAHNASGYVNQNIFTSSDHRFSIRNDTGMVQRYHFKYSISIGSDSGIHEGDIDVPKGGSWFDAASCSLTVNKNRIDNYQIIAETRLEGESRASDQNRATLTVR
jgi:hypothetical protein